MSWSVNFEVEETSCWLIFVNTIGSKQRYRWISGPWFVRYDFHWSLDFPYPNLNWNELNLVWGGKIESVQHVPFSLSTKNKRNKRDSQRIETYVWSFDVFCLSLEQQARLETKSGQIGSQGKPTQTMRLEKEAAKSTGKHFRNPNLVNILTPVIQDDEWQISCRNVGHLETKEISTPSQFYTSPSKMA